MIGSCYPEDGEQYPGGEIGFGQDQNFVRDRVKPTLSPPSVAGIEKLLTLEGREAELNEGNTLFLIKGTEERLRWLRKMDYEAAIVLSPSSPSAGSASDRQPSDDSA